MKLKVLTRESARQEIRDAAHRRRRTKGQHELVGFADCVSICRANSLVTADVLVAAGVKAVARPVPRRTLLLTAKQRREIALGGAWEHAPGDVTSGAACRSHPRAKVRGPKIKEQKEGRK